MLPTHQRFSSIAENTVLEISGQKRKVYVFSLSWMRYLIRGKTGMDFETLEVTENNDIYTIALNRPEVHNAMNEPLMKELTQCMQQLSKNKSTRRAVPPTLRPMLTSVYTFNPRCSKFLTINSAILSRYSCPFIASPYPLTCNPSHALALRQSSRR